LQPDVTMAIKSEFFTGETPPHMLANPIVAMQQLNMWRVANPMVRLINIETAQRTPVAQDPSEEFIELLFDGLRVWYEE